MKKIFRNIVLSGLALLPSFYAGAQQLPVMNHYLYNPYLYNPARTGDTGLGSINLNFKKQWASLPYSPITGALSLEAPVPNTDMGVGAMFYSDRTHIINRMGGMATYAYHIPFSKDYAHHLSLGMSVGFTHQSFNFQDATVENTNDPELLMTTARGTAFDFSFGMNYRWKDLNVGVSMLQGLNNQMRFLSALGDEVKYINTRHFIMTASYDFELGEKKDFFLRPVVMTRVVPGLPVQAEGNLVFGWRRIIWAGLGYRSSNNETATSAIIATLGVELKKRIFFAYTLEMNADATLNNALGAQHEFMVAYRFGKDEAKEKEMVDMRHEIEKLKETDRMLEDKIAATNRSIDTLNQKTDEMGKANSNMNDKIANLENTASANNQVNEELRKKMQDQQDLINAQQAAIDQNRKAIEELREAIKKQPGKYKKMGEIQFTMASADLTATEKSKLDALKPALAGKPNATIYLYGNASTDGDPNKNLELSAKRCIAVRKYLVGLGIPGDKIIVLPMGQENTATGTTAVNPVDRRVDIMVAE